MLFHGGLWSGFITDDECPHWNGRLRINELVKGAQMLGLNLLDRLEKQGSLLQLDEVLGRCPPAFKEGLWGCHASPWRWDWGRLWIDELATGRTFSDSAYSIVLGIWRGRFYFPSWEKFGGIVRSLPAG